MLAKLKLSLARIKGKYRIYENLIVLFELKQICLPYVVTHNTCLFLFITKLDVGLMS